MTQEIGYPTRNGSLDVCATPKRAPEITVELSRIDQALDGLEKCLAEHCQRISPILRTEPEKDCPKNGCADEHRSSSVGSNLQQIRHRVERLTAGLNSTTALVEV